LEDVRDSLYAVVEVGEKSRSGTKDRISFRMVGVVVVEEDVSIFLWLRIKTKRVLHRKVTKK